LEDLDHLRDNDADGIWIHRRDKLVATAREVFEAETRDALGGVESVARGSGSVPRSGAPEI
jgi:hypothetical protein